MTRTLGKIRVRCMAGGLALAAALAPAFAAGPAAAPARLTFEPEGRWEQVMGTGGHTLRLGTLEISRCEEGYCGRLVTGDACGGVAMQLAVETADVLLGTLSLSGRDFDVMMEAGDAPGESLVLTASEGGSFVSRRSMPVHVELVARGASRCDPLPVS